MRGTGAGAAKRRGPRRLRPRGCTPRRRPLHVQRNPTRPLELIAEETGTGDADIEPWVVANAMMGVHQALIGYTRRRIVDGARPARLARELSAQADQALSRLEQGPGGLRGQAPAAEELTGSCAIRR